MNADAAVRRRLEAEIGRIFGEMIAAQERANMLAAEVAALKQKLAEQQDQAQKEADQ